MRESKVEAYLKRKVRAAGGEVYKFKSPGRRNVTDDIVVWSRVTYGHKWGAKLSEISKVITAAIHFVECKAPGKEANAGQAREHVRLQKLGCVVLVIDTIEKVDSYVERNK